MVGYQLDTLLGLLGEHERHALQREFQVKVNGATDGLARRMRDRDEIRMRWELLPELARELLSRVLGREDCCIAFTDLLDGISSRTSVEVERGVEELERHGFLFRVEDNAVERLDASSLALPDEIARVLHELPPAGEDEDTASADANGVEDEEPHVSQARRLEDPAGLSLKAWLEERHFRQAREKARANGATDADAELKLQKRAKQHARQAYKLFLQPVAVKRRIERLPEDLRDVVETAMLRFGGLLPRDVWIKTRGDAACFDREGISEQLEDALLGRVVQLDLRKFGIHGCEETLVVFQDVTLVHLRARAAATSAAPREERVTGVDLVTNLMRFLRYVDENGVRFTLRGEIFQATKKRMLAQLVHDASAHGESAELVFDFINRFARSRGLIEATGERTLRLGEAGRAFEEQGLEDKLRDLLAFAIEDPHGAGDPFHQRRLRRIVIRLLRRLEAERWYDAMHVPFLARNAYLVQMAELSVREHYDGERDSGRFVAREDLRKLAWHLFDWVRRRLHPLGLVDLGFEQGHPTAIRLSRLGAALLQEAPAQSAEGARSTLVVNPDFEVLLFPDSDVWPLVHSLDRFAKRTSSDRLFRFQLSEESVRSALADGMGLGQIFEVLTLRCRTPLPQNVRFSLEDWAARAGAVRLTRGRRLVAPKPELLEKLLAHKAVAELCEGDASDLTLRAEVRALDFRAILRDLDFSLELPHDSDEDEGA